MVTLVPFTLTYDIAARAQVREKFPTGKIAIFLSESATLPNKPQPWNLCAKPKWLFSSHVWKIEYFEEVCQKTMSTKLHASLKVKSNPPAPVFTYFLTLYIGRLHGFKHFPVVQKGY